MPKQELPSKESFYDFFEAMEKELNARRLERSQMTELLQRIPGKLAEKKRKKKGIEECLLIADNNKEVHWWSTFVATDGKARESDEGWVLGIDKRYPHKPFLFSFPIRRTKHYLETSARYLRAFKDLITTWPSCPVCGAELRMKLAGTEMHAVAFYCPNGHKKHTFSIYQNLSDANKKFLEDKFKRFYSYRSRDFDKTGKVREYSRVIRSVAKNKLLQTSGSKDTQVIDTTVYDDLKYEKFPQ